MFGAAGDTARGGRDSHVRAARLRVGVVLALCAAGFACARAVGGAWPVHSWAWFAACGGAVAGCAVAGGVVRGAWAVRALGSAAVVCCAGGVFTARVLEVRGDRLDRLVREGVVCVEGRVLDGARRSRAPATVLGGFMPREPSWSFELGLRGVEGGAGLVGASGRVRVFVRGTESPAVRAGDIVRVTGDFAPGSSSGNPGDGGWELWRNQAGGAGVLGLPGPGLVEPAPGGAVDRGVALVLRARAWLRGRAEQVVRGAAGEGSLERRALLESLLLGRTEVGVESGEVTGAFTRLGLLHVLSISGFHLTVMAALALWLLRLTGDRGRLEPLALCAVVLAYMSIVPASSPVLRSGAMVVSLLAVEASGRRYDRLCVLGWIALGLLVWRPMDLWGLGFQLSLGLTGLLLSAGERFTEGVFTPVLRGLVDDATLVQRVRRALRASVAVGVMCWVVSLPAVMHATGLVSPVAVPATLLVSPVIVLLLWVGYVALLAGVVVPGAGVGAAFVVERLGSLALWTTARLDALPFSSVRVPPVPGWWALLATVVGVVWAHRLGWGRWRWVGVWVLVAALLAGAWLAAPVTPRGVALRVDMLNVGDGTCMLVRSGGDVVMWDCKAARGGVGSLPGVVSAARAVGVWRVARVVVTHPDLDHFGGLPEVVGPLGVEEVVVPRRFLDVAAAEERGAAAALLADLRGRGVAVRVAGEGDGFRLGGGGVRFVWPVDGAGGGGDNDSSLVAVCGAGRGLPGVLLTGDVQEGAIRALRGVEVGRVAAMELPHHGAWSGESEAWLRQVSPSVVLQSTGAARAADARWGGARGEFGEWLTTSAQGWGAVEVMEDGTVRVVRGATGGLSTR